jgi:hypothetical protein
VYGNKPQEQTEYLSLEFNGQILEIVAYNKGNGYVKLFSLQDYINFYYTDKEYNSFDVTWDEYNDDTSFESLIKEHFFQTL